MEFTLSFMKVLNEIPLGDAVNRVRSAAQLENADPDEAERDYRVLRGEPVGKYEPRQAVQALQGVPIREHSELITPLLESGGRVELALKGGQIVLSPSIPTSTRQRYYFTHKGKPVEGPLVRFLRAHYPKSKAAQILLNPGRSSKTVVGAWEAIQRDPNLRKHFGRKVKARKRAHQRAA